MGLLSACRNSSSCSTLSCIAALGKAYHVADLDGCSRLCSQDQTLGEQAASLARTGSVSCLSESDKFTPRLAMHNNPCNCWTFCNQSALRWHQYLLKMRDASIDSTDGCVGTSAPIAFSCKVVGFVMPLAKFANDYAMIHLMHALLNLRPKRPIWQPAVQY